ncbi:hypothetical protein J2S44_003565 [Catenuloplanes niger]|uniref:Uncharacterized protein n=1 Tax=Catenuloplanes niger TaxID=587534 RepID=A0AAE3ZR92_9ACTN|nr:hypothetical protein [Catenuloplanes niger]
MTQRGHKLRRIRRLLGGTLPATGVTRVHRPAARPSTPDSTPHPAGDRPAGDRPAGDRPAGDRPAGDRPAGTGPADTATPDAGVMPGTAGAGGGVTPGTAGGGVMPGTANAGSGVTAGGGNAGGGNAGGGNAGGGKADGVRRGAATATGGCAPEAVGAVDERRDGLGAGVLPGDHGRPRTGGRFGSYRGVHRREAA